MSAVAGAPWLLADVGGTNVRFALAQPDAAAPLRSDTMRAYRVAEFPSLAAAARTYLGSPESAGERPAHAVLALAGRVEGEQVRMTNHSWIISAPVLRAELGLATVELVNDFAAVAMSLPLLGAGDLLALGPAVRPIGPSARRQSFCVLGPGTGLGVSALVVQGAAVTGLQTEGGHIGFAPGDEEEIAVLRELMKKFGRVSVERLLCGAGLVNLLEALAALRGRDAQALAPEDITACARTGADALCVRAVEMFCAMLGAVAGDFALAYGAWDGVYLAGGLLEPIAPWIRGGGFRARFDAKGRFAPAMALVPVALVTHAQPGLLGAAGFAVAASGRALLRGPGAH